MNTTPTALDRLFACLLPAAGLLAGCVAPGPVVLDARTPSAWTQATPPLAAPPLAAPPVAAHAAAIPQAWWQVWNDGALNALVDEALATNLDLGQAEHRLRQQRLLSGAAGQAYRPEFKGNIRTLQDVAATDSYFHASIDMAWDLGLFGMAEAQSQVSAADRLDAQARLQAVRVAIVADVVHRYLDIQMARRQRQLLAQLATLDQRGVQLAQVREQQRLGSSEATLQLRIQAAQAQTQQIELQQVQAQAAHGLAVLLGRDRPAPQWLAVDGTAPLPEVAALPFAQLPADLLRTRPDIQQAEALVVRAGGEAGLARSALYPRFVLQGSLLYSYNITGNHRVASGSMPVFGPLIDIPLFDWGRRKAQADASQEGLQAASLAYRKAVVEAVAEAESALAALTAQQARHVLLAQVQELLQARAVAEGKRQQLGLASEYSGLPAQRAALLNQSAQTTAQAAHALAYVALYKALGGAPVSALQEPEDRP